MKYSRVKLELAQLMTADVTFSSKGREVSTDKWRRWFSSQKEKIFADYFSFLRFASISTDSSYQNEINSCADWLYNYLKNECALDTKILKTQGHPIVFAESEGKKKETLLLYGHYDVQPVDPTDLWKSNPFEPQKRDGKIFARGAVDDKGQIFYAITALRAFKELGVPFPSKIKLCIEGEEEIGSPSLSKEMKTLKNILKADSILVIDFDQFDEQTPSLHLAARGLLAFEIELIGSEEDLHSGVHGGMAYNPNRALVEILSVFDETGKVQIEGFYEDVEELTAKEKEKVSFRYLDEQSYSKECGVYAIGGEKGYSLKERNTLRPTFEINGISGGYTKEGIKTVIPKSAKAKISCRLVPNQDPKKLFSKIQRHFEQKTPKNMKLQIQYLGGEKAFRSKGESSLAKALMRVSSDVMQKPCVSTFSGASIPIMAKMQEEIAQDLIGMGYCLPSDAIHAPNEHFDEKRFESGFLTVARLLECL